jgi:2-polyprenyl-3-methyl-5-hydroxy-6-metoxy-1,4-benzoquinol methylase
VLRPDRDAHDYARFYDEIGAAQLEERYMATNWYTLARMHLVLDWLRPVARRGGKLLDVGCASGYYSVAFAKAGGRATGVDISEASIGLARRRAEMEAVADRCEFFCGDMRSLTSSEGHYDAVSMVEVLEHVREQPEAVAQAVRALRPGGILVLATPHAFDKLPRWQRFRHRNAQTPEAAGVDVERLGTNPFVADSGIAHEPYFHDAFTFEQLRVLVSGEAEVVRLHSLYMPVPGMRLLGHLPPTLRRRIRRLVGGVEPSLTENQPAADRVKTDEPLPIPPLNKDAALMVKLSKVMWRIPVIRMTYNHNLLVARRREHL